MNLLNPNEIIQLFSTKNHFKWSFSLWFFGQRSSLLYHGLVWFCLISQFSDPKIVCQSNIPQDYEIAQWYCLFKQTKIVQDDVEDSMQRFQLPYRINQIYACLLPTLIMMVSQISKSFINFNHFRIKRIFSFLKSSFVQNCLILSENT